MEKATCKRIAASSLFDTVLMTIFAVSLIVTAVLTVLMIQGS
jgi:hypothetical protein